MTSTDRLSPFFDLYSTKVKTRRRELRMSVRDLADKSGVPYSNVSRVNSGSQSNPLLFNEAAVADTLGLSLDELCGLSPPTKGNKIFLDRIAELEEKNARLEERSSQLADINSAAEAENDRLSKSCNDLKLENAKLSAVNGFQNQQIKSTHELCYVLVFFCVVLALSLVIYLVVDSQITDAGIIRNGELSVLAWLFIALIVASIIAIGHTISKVVRKERKEAHTCNNV